MKRFNLLLILLFILASILTSCNTTDDIVLVRTSKAPTEMEGFLIISTNDKIPVTVHGRDDIYAEEDLAGRVVIPVEDLAVLIRNNEDYLRLLDEMEPK